MAQKPTKKDERYDFAAYSVGPINASVCAKRFLPLKEVTARLNREEPTGISSKWTPSKNRTFSGGEPQPGPCNQWPDTHIHYLFHC